MTKENYGTRKSFKQLDVAQRAKIELLLKQNIPKARIGEIIGIVCSTLYKK